MTLAWQTASLNAIAYHKPKKMPKLEMLLHSDDASSKRNQTPDEQIAALKAIWKKRKN